jgi:hypothetical protein
MRTYQGYEQVTVGDIPQKKLEKAIKTGKLSLAASDLKGSRKILLHPSNAKLVKESKRKNKGITGMGVTAPEILSDLDWHDSMGGNLHGGSLWSWLKGAAKSVGKFFKDNWDVVKPVVSRIADVAVPAAATFFGAPEVAGVARSGIKSLTGVGVTGLTTKDKRLAALAKARAVKAAKSKKGSGKVNVLSAGSFLIN